MGNAMKIEPFQSENQEAVKRLVLDGLVEHWGWLDPHKNPDLNDITASYAQDYFLVAWEGDTIIGTGAFVHRAAGIVEIVRMSVARKARRQGVGRMILGRLIERAREESASKIILETTETWQEVIVFYLKAGFHITHSQGGDVYFEMVL